MKLSHVLFSLGVMTLLGVPAYAADMIRIGVPVGLSGANSVVAPSIVQASELAVDEINAAGGILGKKVELIVADDASGAVGAQQAFDSLIFKKGVDVIISAETSAARNAALPIVSRGRVPISIPVFMRATPATSGCMSTAGFRNSFLRPSLII